MSIQAISQTGTTANRAGVKWKLPRVRLATYERGTETIRNANAPTPRMVAAGLVGEFLASPPTGAQQAGILSFGKSAPQTLGEKIYRTALEAPGSVTYKDGDAHVFGYRTWTPGTKKGRFPGYNSCARVASAVLMKAGVNTGMQDRVVDLESRLQGRGWKKVDLDDIKKGDVVIWKHEKGANHIGFYAGWRLNMQRGFGQTTVDNFSVTGEPEFRALNRETEWGWSVRKVLRAP